MFLFSLIFFFLFIEKDEIERQSIISPRKGWENVPKKSEKKPQKAEKRSIKDEKILPK